MAEVPLGFVLLYARRFMLGSALSGWLLVHPVLLDMCSAYLNTRYLLRGRDGRHGQMGVSWFCYVGIALFGFPIPWWERPLLLVGLTLFHAGAQLTAPVWIAKRLGRRPEEPVRR